MVAKRVNPHWRLAAACLLLGAGLSFCGCRRGTTPAPFLNQPLPEDRTYTDAAQSPHFRLRGSVTLCDEAGEGRRRVLFDLTVENRTEQPIRGLRVKAELPEAVRAYHDAGYASFRTFGQPEPIDLVPGQAPRGLQIACEEALPDPATATTAERERLYDALRQPIRLGLWWEDGEAYLELQPEDILYTGFPRWAAQGQEPAPLRARVELDIYSDRPNPSWELAEREASLGVVAALFKGGYPPRDEGPRCPQQAGYRGFLVTLTDGPRGLPLGLRVCGGRMQVWEVGSEAEAGVIQDVAHELEWYLLDSGRPYVDAQVYETVRGEIERSTRPEDSIPYARARVQEYRLACELPQDLPGEAPVYRVVAGPVPEAEWARRVAAALGFSGDPAAESRSAAQPEWTWVGPQSDQVLTVDGAIGYQCSAPPAGAEKRPKLASAEEAIAAARAWLAERELLPGDCAGDVQAWPGIEGLGWEISFRRRLGGTAVGSYWSWSGGVKVRLNSLGQVDFVTYVRRDVDAGEMVPLKGVQAAWEELQSRGPAFFDAEGPPTGPEYGVFTIEEVRLGYREGGVGTSEEQTELRPYYVFGGRAELPVAGQEVRLDAYVPAEASALPRSMKGYDLYSWREGDGWRFTLITGTNRSKTCQEVTAGEDRVDGGWVRLGVAGVPALKGVLARLPRGESVLWARAGWPGLEGQCPLALPDEPAVEEIRAHCERLGIELSLPAVPQEAP